MLQSETIGAVVFITVVAVTLTGGVIALIRRSRKWFDILFLTASGIGILCILYGRLVEPFRLSITRVEIRAAKLPFVTPPIRIVQLSDIHSDPTPRLERKIPAAVAAEKPDVIVFTGDAINSVGGLPVFRQLMSELSQIAPTYAVRGNWDVAYWSGVKLYEGTGVRELNGQASRIEIRGTPIWIGGLADGNAGALSMMLGVPRTEVSVLLYHRPELLAEAARERVDLYLSGHTHGGQVALPFYGAIITLSKFGKRYEAGLYREGNTAMYVNRGIGMEGFAPRVRFWSPPEITVFTIKPPQ